MNDEINKQLADLILAGHLKARDADRMAGFLRTLCRMYCLEPPQITHVGLCESRMDVEVWWESESLRVQVRRNGKGLWSGRGAGWQSFVWIADDAEFEVGRGLEVRI